MSLKSYLKRGIRYVLHGTPNVLVNATISYLAPNELLKGRVALITGGTSGIGFEIAKAFIRAGASVIITGRNNDKIKNACTLIEKEMGRSESIYGLELDNTRVDTFKDAFEKALSVKGKIDILVNNAGILGCSFGSGTGAEFSAVIDTNLKGVFFLSQLVAHYMKDNKIKGNILNIASSSSLRPAASAYTLSKWGIRGLTLGMARMLTPHGIVVNGLAPGPTATPMLMPNGVKDNIALESNLTGRFALPGEIANMAVILVSDMSRMIVGDIVYMTGGAGNITNEDMNYDFE